MKLNNPQYLGMRAAPHSFNGAIKPKKKPLRFSGRAQYTSIRPLGVGIFLVIKRASAALLLLLTRSAAARHL
jgi:hypothetical protein